MSVVTREPRLDAPDDWEAPSLIHIAATCCPPYEKFLCGRTVNGRKPLRPDIEATCVVCMEMERTVPYCPRCDLWCAS